MQANHNEISETRNWFDPVLVDTYCLIFLFHFIYIYHISVAQKAMTKVAKNTVQK